MTLPDLTMFLFGVLTLGGGMTGLLRPDLLLSLLGVPVTDPRLFLVACSQASIAMGLYYILSAVHRNREFFAWSIPVRLLNFCVFTGMVVLHLAPSRWLAVAGFELAGALATAWALTLKGNNPVFDRFQALRIACILLAFMGGVLAFSVYGIHGSASIFLAVSSAGMMYAYRNFAPMSDREESSTKNVR